MRLPLALLAALSVSQCAHAQLAPRQPKIIIFETDGVPSTGSLVQAQPASTAPYYSRAAVVELLEDESRWFASQLVTGTPAEAVSEHNDCYSGVSSVKVIGHQRFSEFIKGWGFPIVAKPGPGEYRYIRFAWKKRGGGGIMVQFHDRNTGAWERRYVGGPNNAGYTAVSVGAKAPTEWTVVTRDLHADFLPFTLSGIALTPMDGEAGLFDHIYLGRTIEDLDQITNAVREQSRRQEKLDAARLDRLWDDLASSDAALAQPAISHLVSGRADSLAYIKKRIADLDKQEGNAEMLALIAQLDHPRFAVRDDASRKLERLGSTAVPALKNALPKAASLEVATRIEQLLSKPGLRDVQWSPRELRILRLIRALEQVESREALDVLEAIPFASTAVYLKDEGNAAVERMQKRLR